MDDRQLGWQNEKPLSNNDSKTSIKVGYECAKKILELDTENIVSDMNVMESVNNISILKFRDLELYCSEMKANSDEIKRVDESLKKSLPKLNEIEKRIDKLLMVVNEMDEWSQELEVKSRRYIKHKH